MGRPLELTPARAVPLRNIVGLLFPVRHRRAQVGDGLVTDELDGDLGLIDRQPVEVGEAAVAGAEVIEHQPAPEFVEPMTDRAGVRPPVPTPYARLNAASGSEVVRTTSPSRVSCQATINRSPTRVAVGARAWAPAGASSSRRSDPQTPPVVDHAGDRARSPPGSGR